MLRCYGLCAVCPRAGGAGWQREVWGGRGYLLRQTVLHGTVAVRAGGVRAPGGQAARAFGLAAVDLPAGVLPVDAVDLRGFARGEIAIVARDGCDVVAVAVSLADEEGVLLVGGKAEEVPPGSRRWVYVATGTRASTAKRFVVTVTDRRRRVEENA